MGSSGHEAMLEDGYGAIGMELASLSPEAEAIEGTTMEAAGEGAAGLAARSAPEVVVTCDAFQVDSEVIGVCVDEWASVSTR